MIFSIQLSQLQAIIKNEPPFLMIIAFSYFSQLPIASLIPLFTFEHLFSSSSLSSFMFVTVILVFQLALGMRMQFQQPLLLELGKQILQPLVLVLGMGIWQLTQFELLRLLVERQELVQLKQHQMAMVLEFKLFVDDQVIIVVAPSSK